MTLQCIFCLFLLFIDIIIGQTCDGDIIHMLVMNRIFEATISDNTVQSTNTEVVLNTTLQKTENNIVTRHTISPVFVRASAVDPNTGKIFIIADSKVETRVISDLNSSYLVNKTQQELLMTLSINNGNAVPILFLDEIFEDITFDCNGILYGITSNYRKLNNNTILSSIYMIDSGMHLNESWGYGNYEYIMSLDNDLTDYTTNTLSYNWDNGLFYRMYGSDFNISSDSEYFDMSSWISNNSTIKFESIDIINKKIKSINISIPDHFHSTNLWKDYTYSFEYIGDNTFYMDSTEVAILVDIGVIIIRLENYNILEIDSGGSVGNMSIVDWTRTGQFYFPEGHAQSTLKFDRYLYKHVIIPTMGENSTICIPSNICPPTLSPTKNPTLNPTKNPTLNPTINPTKRIEGEYCGIDCCIPPSCPCIPCDYNASIFYGCCNNECKWEQNINNNELECSGYTPKNRICPIQCGDNHNSGPGRDIQCINDDDCCNNFICKIENAKCVKNDYSSSSSSSSSSKNKHSRHNKNNNKQNEESAYVHSGNILNDDNKNDKKLIFIVLFAICILLIINFCFIIYCIYYKRKINKKTYLTVNYKEDSDVESNIESDQD